MQNPVHFAISATVLSELRRGSFAPLLDFALITHNHNDHYTERFKLAMDRVHPKTAVIAHLQELGHAKGRYRWTYRDGLDEKAQLEAAGISARMPLWGERLV